MTKTSTGPCQVVWFKRDLLLHDHEPLTRAPEQGPALPLYIIELDLWQKPDMSGRPFTFLRESLIDLRDQLGSIEPWHGPAAERMLQDRYPEPIVDERAARKGAQMKIWAVRRTADYRKIADAIQLKQGSRKSGIPQHERRVDAVRREQKSGQGAQLSLLAGD
ncbi:MAG: deoxyribodipyrimidine photo-lyase [Pseudomonadota bacterium]